MPALSAYGRASAEPSPVNRMMAGVAADFRQGVDVNLGVGYVNEATIPRQLISQAVGEVVGDGERYPLALNYGGPHGTARLIRSLQRYLAAHDAGYRAAGGGFLDDREIIVGANGATSLLESLATVLGPGLVVTGDPSYYIYTSYLRRAGFDILAIPEDEQGIPPEAVAARLGRMSREERAAIRFVYAMAVGNPTSTVLARERQLRLLEIVRDLSESRGEAVPLVVDRAYVDLVHDPALARPTSLAAHDREGLLFEVGTVSKILAPGLRVGYLVGAPGPMMQALVQRTSDLGFSAPPLNQEVASWLLDHHIGTQLQKVIGEYREKALRVRGWLDRYLGNRLSEVRGGGAGFYYYVTLERTRTDEASAFFRELTLPAGDRPRVLYLPGEHCVEPGGELGGVARRQMRLSYGFESLDRIEVALRRMGEVVD